MSGPNPDLGPIVNCLLIVINRLTSVHSVGQLKLDFVEQFKGFQEVCVLEITKHIVDLFSDEVAFIEAATHLVKMVCAGHSVKVATKIVWVDGESLSRGSKYCCSESLHI